MKILKRNKDEILSFSVLSLFLALFIFTERKDITIGVLSVLILLIGLRAVLSKPNIFKNSFLVSGILFVSLQVKMHPYDYDYFHTYPYLVMIYGLVLSVKIRKIISSKKTVGNSFGIKDNPLYLYASKITLLTIASGFLFFYAAPDFYHFYTAILAVETVVLFVCTFLFIRTRISNPNKISSLIHEYSPNYAIYFSAPRGTDFQVGMWLKYLDSLDGKMIVILRENRNYEAIRKLVPASPVVVCPTLGYLDTCIPESLKAVFYTNNSMKNTHMVRYKDITHIHIGHGDSDKAPSFNPVTAMYDKVFVAGQLGIDRYERNGVFIPEEKFEIVGRPQLEKIVPGVKDQVKNKCVLYAPTWLGHNTDSAYSSISIAVEIIQKLLLTENVKIIVKLHPYLFRDKRNKLIIDRLRTLLLNNDSTKHIFVEKDDQSKDIFEYFNMSDCIICDVSSVASDYIYSEKPMCVTNMMGNDSELTELFPISSVTYVLDEKLDNLDSCIDELLHTDSKMESRLKFKQYVLGDFDAESYADNFKIKANTVLNDI